MNVKYRVWDGYSMRYPQERLSIAPSEFYLDMNGRLRKPYVMPDGRFALSDTADHVVMFWTGYRDENDQDIYEGDVLKLKDTVVGLVYWKKKQAAWGIRIEKDYNPSLSYAIFMLYDCVGGKGVVLGNKYEHPDVAEMIHGG